MRRLLVLSGLVISLRRLSVLLRRCLLILSRLLVLLRRDVAKPTKALMSN